MRQSQKHTLRRYANDLASLYGMRDMVLADGTAKGVRAIEMNNGRGMMMTVLPDRCLDIPYLSYKNINIGLYTKSGLSAPAYFVEDGVRGFLRQFNGGLMTTCGITYAGAPDEIDGRKYGLHGTIANKPASCVNRHEVVTDDRISLCVSGEVREACTFEEYMVLHREILLDTERNTIHIHDEVENRGFEPQPVMNLYHINFGYPLLDAGARVYFSTPDIAPRDADAAAGINDYWTIGEPEIGYLEQCFIHTGGQGSDFAMLHNPRLGLAAVVNVDSKQLPIFNQWKCMRTGDYALGLEPSASGFLGRTAAKERGWVRYLEGGETRRFDIRIDILDDADEIAALAAGCKESQK